MLIQKIKSGVRISTIRVDNKDYKVTQTVLTAKGCAVGDKITPDELEYLINESDRENAWESLLALLSRAPHTIQDCRDILRDKGYRYTSVRHVIDKGIKMGVLNDKKFAEFHVLSNCEIKGVGLIKSEMKAKGVSDEIIDEAIENADINEPNVCIEVTMRFMKGKNIADPRTKERLVKFLIGRGFSIDNIKNAMPLIGHYIGKDEGPAVDPSIEIIEGEEIRITSTEE
ncbi:MAG: recombination regulator RecX [Christensenellaceae bacterium]|jgi:regulatory protein|nr:recombination regulator RecX [Christensenellaceae bacterium]